jgi:hypothetical protein
LKIKQIFIFVLLLSSKLSSFAQDITQTIRGTVIEKQTQIPIPGANVILLYSDPLKGTTTDINGNFILEEVPLSRQSLRISYLGYLEITLDNIIVNAAKEVILNIELEESAISLEGVTVTASKMHEPINKMASVSARLFTVEETNRYAGSWADPARMVSNYAGVNAANDERNDIVIRGNSPTGLLWRLEGVNIPNPNHFATNGTTGGAVSILNNNSLSTSGFYTGAFPAQYGNATSGAFDLTLRKGNSERHEYLAEFAVFGLQAGAEGPLKKKNGGSYIFNYRYSTIGLFDNLGLAGRDIPSIPKYQDITFKIDFGGNKKIGHFSLFGIGGLSNMNYKFIEQNDNDYDIHDVNRNKKTKIVSNMGVIGLSHNKILNDKSYIKTVLAYTGTLRSYRADTLLSNSNSKIISANNSTEQKIVFSGFYNHKLNKKNNYRIGILAENVFYDYADSIYTYNDNNYRTQLNADGGYFFGEAYIQWQHKFNDKLILNYGIHGQFLGLNHTGSVEPRLGINWKINKTNNVSFGFGKHSQIQAIPIYLTETRIGPVDYIHTNKDLEFTKSLHFVASYDFVPSNGFRVKIEPYYQYLYDVPVEKRSSYFSALNIGSDFTLPLKDSLQNTGTGRNYGIDITLERFFINNYYYLLTASFYDSKATGSDGIERNTVFNGNFTLNVLGGYEFSIGKHSALQIDAKIAYLGNRRYIPIDFAESQRIGYQVLDYDQAYVERYKDFFKLDFKVGLRLNLPKTTHHIIFDVTNVLNTQNVWQDVYSSYDNKKATMYTYGRMPNFIYRIEF